jgi:serine phosphatase RsbU (regulator of sigma subunit)
MSNVLNLVDQSVEKIPLQWYCHIVEGGNNLSSESFDVPGLNGYLLSVPYKDAKQGGDIHYITVCNHGAYSKFLILDVSGHGEDAGQISKQLYQPLFDLLDERDNNKILEKLNEIMISLNLGGKFATVVVATYNRYFCSWTFSYAGHPPMLHFQNNSWQSIKSSGSAPIGIVDNIEFQQSTIFLQPGDRILLFSDALTEIKLKNNKRLDETGLLKTLSSLAPNNIGTYFKELIQALIKLNQGEQFSDDLTFILLEHNPKLAARISLKLSKIFLPKKLIIKLCTLPK